MSYMNLHKTKWYNLCSPKLYGLAQESYATNCIFVDKYKSGICASKYSKTTAKILDYMGCTWW